MFVDSSFLVALARGDDAAAAFYRANEFEEYSATTIVGYELFAGLVDRGRGELVDELKRDLDWVDFEPFQLADAAETARIEGELAREGTPIPVPDAMIAASAGGGASRWWAQTSTSSESGS
jgi:predicted nucleic acid-binding protein